jgi:hypothetical protein
MVLALRAISILHLKRVKLNSSTGVAAEVDDEVTTIERQNAKVVQPTVRLRYVAGFDGRRS